jgi:hypothetical protein
MWTYADTMWTDADCSQKCGEMWTINVDSTKTCSITRAINGKRYVQIQYSTPPIGQASVIFEAIQLALLPMNYPARINFVDTEDKQKMWKDVDCLQ